MRDEVERSANTILKYVQNEIFQQNKQESGWKRLKSNWAQTRCLREFVKNIINKYKLE